MPDLVAEDARHLGLVLGQRQQAAGDVDVAARQREGVGDLAVEEGEGELGVGQVGGRGEARADLVDIGLQLRIRILAAELLQDPRVLLLADPRSWAGERVVYSISPVAGFSTRSQPGCRARPIVRSGQAETHPAGHGRTWICSGWDSSISGPPASSTKPRTSILAARERPARRPENGRSSRRVPRAAGAG